MSIQAVGWVFDHSPTRLTDRLVLLSIANHAGEHPSGGAWESWPGVETIAREAGLDRTRTVQEALSRLIDGGHIERVVNGAPDHRIRKDRRPNLYRVIRRRCEHGCVGCDRDRHRATRQRGDATPHPVTPDGVTPPRTPSPVDNPDDGVTPTVTPLPPRGDASRHNGVTPHDTTGCREASPEPSVEPSVEPPPLPPQFQHEPELDPSGGSTIDQQPAHPPALTGDERRQRIHEAATIMATWLSKSAVGVAKPSKWIGSVAERLEREHATDGQRLLTENPDLDPDTLAHLLEHPEAREAADQRARQRQAEEDTRRRLRDTLVQPGNRHRSPEDIARLRDQLRLPRRDTA